MTLAFSRHLLAENTAPRTIETYLESLRHSGEYLAQQGMPTDRTLDAREHVEAFVADLLTKHKPAAASNR